jgi:hypothetical protein
MQIPFDHLRFINSTVNHLLHLALTDRRAFEAAASSLAMSHPLLTSGNPEQLQAAIERQALPADSPVLVAHDAAQMAEWRQKVEDATALLQGVSYQLAIAGTKSLVAVGAGVKSDGLVPQAAATAGPSAH